MPLVAYVQVENTAVLYGNQGLFGAFDINCIALSGNIVVIDSNSFTGTGSLPPGPSSPAVGITFDGGFAVAIIT